MGGLLTLLEVQPSSQAATSNPLFDCTLAKHHRCTAASVARVRQIADQYTGFGQPVMPTFKIIATVASAFAGSDGNYSNEFPTSKFEPWIAAAAVNCFHVVLDLQSGVS